MYLVVSAYLCDYLISLAQRERDLRKIIFAQLCQRFGIWQSIQNTVER